MVAVKIIALALAILSFFTWIPSGLLFQPGMIDKIACYYSNYVIYPVFGVWELIKIFNLFTLRTMALKVIQIPVMAIIPLFSPSAVQSFGGEKYTYAEWYANQDHFKDFIEFVANKLFENVVKPAIDWFQDFWKIFGGHVVA